MRAVIFDIDGTLLRSSEADSDLYAAAIRAVLGDVQLRKSWGDYEHVSDSGILAEVLKDNSIGPTDIRVPRVRAYFIDSLSRHIDRHGPFNEIPGARDFVVSLHRSSKYAIAYATGGWHGSALLKLISAGFPVTDIPLATSDDHPARVEIMRHALSRLEREFDSITYYGDGTWDRAAAAQLGWQFVPVGIHLSGLEKYEPAGV